MQSRQSSVVVSLASCARSNSTSCGLTNHWNDRLVQQLSNACLRHWARAGRRNIKCIVVMGQVQSAKVTFALLPSMGIRPCIPDQRNSCDKNILNDRGSLLPLSIHNYYVVFKKE